MRRVLIIVMCSALLTGCVHGIPAVDPKTGEGLHAAGDAFDRLSAEQQLAEIAASDLIIERALWAESGIESALGGPEAADAVFEGLHERLAAVVARASGEDDGISFSLAARRDDDSPSADGAGMFAGMLLGDLLSSAGLVATRDGATGDAQKDFGDGSGAMTITADDSGMVRTTLETTVQYNGAQITVVVGSEIDPCPEADGSLSPKGLYNVTVEGPNGTGMATQVEVEVDMHVNDDAQIAFADHAYRIVYVAKRAPKDAALFDLSGSALDYSRDVNGEVTINGSGGWLGDEKVGDEAYKTGEFLSRWVSSSIQKAAQSGWEDGRCIDLQATYSQGPSGLKPDSEVAIAASPIARKDGAPAGGTVTAELQAGESSVTPEGAKVDAVASFTYRAPDQVDKSGTVRLESRSKRGVGILEVTLDTSPRLSYSMQGGAGDFAGSGTICDITKPFTISGGGVTVEFVPADANGGSYSYSGTLYGVGVSGGEAYEVHYVDGVAVSIRGWGVGSVNAEGNAASGYGEEFYTLTALEDAPEGC